MKTHIVLLFVVLTVFLVSCGDSSSSATSADVLFDSTISSNTPTTPQSDSNPTKSDSALQYPAVADTTRRKAVAKKNPTKKKVATKKAISKKVGTKKVATKKAASKKHGTKKANSHSAPKKHRTLPKTNPNQQ